jgi:hypothetical protein
LAVSPSIELADVRYRNHRYMPSRAFLQVLPSDEKRQP